MNAISQYINFIKLEKRYSIHTVTAYQSDLLQFNQFMDSGFQTEILNADYSKVRSWIVSLNAQSISKRSINRKITTLRSFYTFHLRQGNISANPTLKIDLLKLDKKLPVFVDEKSMENIFSEIEFPDDYQGVLAKTCIELLYDTGLRVSELVNLKMYNIDWDGLQIKVLGKRNKERIIPISPNLINQLKIYKDKRNKELSDSEYAEYYFLTKNGKKIYNKLVYRIINYYLSLVTTINKKSPHVIRHTFATHLLNKGADINAIKELLGHSSLAATQVYTHNSIEKLKNVYKQAHPKA